MKPLETFIEQRKERFVKNNLMSDEFLDFVNKNMKPIEKQMSYYQCAIMEVETKLNVLNEEFSLQYDRNPFESIETRLKSPASIIEKLQLRGIPVTVENMQSKLYDIAGIRVVCSFKEDIYRLADLLIQQGLGSVFSQIEV